jgi:hypothetical protein
MSALKGLPDKDVHNWEDPNKKKTGIQIKQTSCHNKRTE